MKKHQARQFEFDWAKEPFRLVQEIATDEDQRQVEERRRQAEENASQERQIALKLPDPSAP